MNFLTVSISSKFWNMKSFDERWSFLYPWTWVYLLNHRCKFCEDWYLLLPSQIFTISMIEKLKHLNFICCYFIVTTNVLYGKIVGPGKKKEKKVGHFSEPTKSLYARLSRAFLADIWLGFKKYTLVDFGLVWKGWEPRDIYLHIGNIWLLIYLYDVLQPYSVFIIFCLLTLMCYQLPPSTQQSYWALTNVPIGTRRQLMGPDMLCQSLY